MKPLRIVRIQKHLRERALEEERRHRRVMLIAALALIAAVVCFLVG
jgi:hypothetical protein